MPAQPTAIVSIETLLRISIVVFVLMVGITSIHSPADGAMDAYISALGFVAFGLAFWGNTRNIAQQNPTRQAVLSLAFQTLCGFTLHTDLLYIVAAEIPLVLPGRNALTWILVQNSLLLVWIWWLDKIGGPVTFIELPQQPHWLSVVITDAYVFSIHAFAFFLGYLAASEARGRRAAERLNAELLATQNLLAQSSRVAERAFVARELHDALGHHLVALKVNLEVAQHVVTDGPAKAPVSDALALVKRLLSDVRSVVSQVRNQPRMELHPALLLLLSGVTEITTTLEFPSDLHLTDPAQAHVLFRCVQEALTNTLKHAKARHFWVTFSQNREGIRLVLQDDGKGAAKWQGGQGLNGMCERLQILGGHLLIASEPGRGFTLTVQLPHPARIQP